jgi:hypothetical protein
MAKQIIGVTPGSVTLQNKQHNHRAFPYIAKLTFGRPYGTWSLCLALPRTPGPQKARGRVSWAIFVTSLREEDSQTKAS